MTEIPHSVQDFIRRHIHSIDALEIILFLHQNPQNALEAGAIGGALNIDVALVKARLEEMVVSGVVITANTRDRCLYKLNASHSDNAQAITELAKWHASYRVKIITLIFTQPLEKIQTFADAFRFTKKEEEK